MILKWTILVGLNRARLGSVHALAETSTRTARLAVYDIRAARLALYHNIYYICAAPTSVGISRYLTTSPIYF